MDVVLKDATWMQGGNLVTADLRIRRDKILKIGSPLSPGKNEKVINLRGHYLYPGLINSHDHLEMNLYSRMGNPPYENYTQWARDIYRPKETPVKEIESVPVKQRLLWGGLKNLISGVTTVVHHNPWHAALGRSGFPVKVLKKYGWAHSLAFQEHLLRRFPNRSGVPFIIHAAEGIDDLAGKEIRELHQLKVLKENTVIIHGINLSSADRSLLEEARASLVWCPASNHFMFGKTTAIALLKNKVRVSLGSDSMMTGSASLLEEMQVAAMTGYANAAEIFDMVTNVPASIFGLPVQNIAEGTKADLLALPRSTADYHENLIQKKPHEVSAVFVDGKLLFADDHLTEDLKLKLYYWKFNQVQKRIAIDVAGLRMQILKKVGKGILESNPLWQTTTSD